MNGTLHISARFITFHKIKKIIFKALKIAMLEISYISFFLDLPYL